MDEKKLGALLIQLVGGKENIQKLTHCATRLRFEFYDKDKVKVEEISKVPEVISVVDKGGQFQVVIGNEVARVYRVIINEIGDNINSSHNNENKKKETLVTTIISVISTTFTPVIPALIGGGMIKSVLSILVLLNIVSNNDSTYQLLDMISDTVFYFLPVLLAYGASIKFECHPVLSIVLACALVHPTWGNIVNSGKDIDYFGIPVLLVSYSYSVIPIILSIWIMSYVERFAEKYTPTIIKFFAKPLIIMFISIPIAIIVIGPFGSYLNTLIERGASVINSYANWLIPMLMGALQPFLILTGTAWAMTPIATTQISKLGYEVVNGPGMLASNIAQAAATLAVAVKSKNLELKELAGSAGFTALMGITEPALYGVNLKLKKPFIASMIAGGLAGIYAGLSGLVRYAFVSPGLAGLPAFIGENPMNIVHAIITCAIAFVGGFVITWIMGFEDLENNVRKEKSDEKSLKTEEIKGKNIDDKKIKEEIYSPIIGKVVSLSDTGDEAFSSRALGEGVGIIPREGKVYSPVNGTISSLFPTKHAIGILSDLGGEILIHVGIDTVNLEGKYFKNMVEEGQKVKRGELLLEFDISEIEKAGYKIVTPVIVVNTDEVNVNILQENREVDLNDKILVLK